MEGGPVGSPWLLAVAIASALLALPGCTTPPQARAPDRALEQGEGDRRDGYEAPPVFRASELLSAEIASGPHHRVEEEIGSDGFLRLYAISSDFGEFTASGDEALTTRVREIQALAALEEMSKRKEFAAAAARALKSPFVATWNLIRHPVDSITGVPAGAWETLRRTSELARGERGELEDSAFREFIGFEAKKRELAHQLGVDPYSSNRALQRQLNRFSWAAFVGGMPSMFVPFAEGPSQRPANRDASAAERIDEILLHFSPEDLRRLNRIELAVMGISETLSDAFITHPWFSPRHQTLLVESLSGLELTADRGAFIELAAAAESEDEASFHQRTAEIFRLYNDNVAWIEAISVLAGRAAGRTADGTLDGPLALDHGAWTRPMAELAGSLSGPTAPGGPVRRTELLLAGTLSPRCRAEIEALGLAVTERVFERLAPPPSEAGGDGQ
jgi:hypothetical protein